MARICIVCECSRLCAWCIHRNTHTCAEHTHRLVHWNIQTNELEHNFNFFLFAFLVQFIFIPLASMCSVFVCVRCAVLYTNNARQHRNGYTHIHITNKPWETINRHSHVQMNTGTNEHHGNLMEMIWQRQRRRDTARKCVYRVYCVCICVRKRLSFWMALCPK